MNWASDLTSATIWTPSCQRVGDLRVHCSLETDIRKWITEWNKNPRPFVWTKSADEILETPAAYCQRITAPGR